MSRVVEVEVEMHAFMGGAIRTVDVPVEEWRAARDTRERLDLVFRYGQNEVQPKRRFASVSVGDVVRLDGERFRVEAFGFGFEWIR